MFFTEKNFFIEKEHFQKSIVLIHASRFFFMFMAAIVLWGSGSSNKYISFLRYAWILYGVYSLLFFVWKKYRDFFFINHPYAMTVIDLLGIFLAIMANNNLLMEFFLLFAFPITFLGIRYGARGSCCIGFISCLLYCASVSLTGMKFTVVVLFRLLFLATFSAFVGLLYESIQRKTYSLAVQDGLTNLYNHRYFYHKLQRILLNAARTGELVSLALMDLDNFKSFNDQMGHLEGDQLLRRVSSIIKGNIRSSDTAARYGGDEFAIIFPNTDSNAATKIAERIRKTICEELTINTNEHLSISIGIATFPTNGQSPTELFQAADKALYQAKDVGKNTIVCHQSMFDIIKETAVTSQRS